MDPNYANHGPNAIQELISIGAEITRIDAEE